MRPGPSHDFAGGLKSWDVPAGDRFVRIHRLGNGAIWFGPGGGGRPQYRFDAPAGQYKVMYAAERLAGAFVETVLRKAGRIIARSYVHDRQWSIVSCARPLKLLKAFDEGLFWHGIDAGMSSSDDYAASRTFALAAYARFPELDGIAYRARHNNGEICYAVFDRLQASDIEVHSTHRFDAHRDKADALVRQHGAVWDMSPMVT